MIGLIVSLAMAFRSQVEGDTLNMLARGWHFAFAGEWLQFGMPTSAGRTSPGGFLALVVGLPLMLWADYRAPAVLVWLLAAIGYLVLDRIVGRVTGPSGRLLFAVFYWLNPWRIHYTSFLWNPNYMFFLGALHLWIAYRLRKFPRFWPSLALVLTFGLATQLHMSAMILATMSLMLWWRRLIKLNWSGVAAGALITAGSIAPWGLLIVQQPELLPGGTGFPFRSLLLVQPALRGLMYLVRYPSLALPRQVYELDLVPRGTGDDPASSMLAYVLIGLGWVTVLLSVWAYRRFFRRSRDLWRRRDWSGADRVWLRGYLFWSLVGAAVAFAAAPTSVMFWQGFPAFHVAVLGVGALCRTRRRRVMWGLVAAWAVASLSVVCALSLSSPMFQRPFSEAGTPVTGKSFDDEPRYVADHPMYHDLGVIDRCGIVIVGEGGWWPDVLSPASQADDVADPISRPPE